jgi:hypothetical protein
MAIGGFKRYDAAQVTVLICNLLIDSGFAENGGEFLTIQQDADDYEDVTGVDGEVARSASNNRAATIELTLMQTSDGNTVLTALQNAGLLAKNGSDVGSFLVRDRVSGLRMYTATKCWIAKAPDASFASKVGNVKWKIRVADLGRVDAGS